MNNKKIIKVLEEVKKNKGLSRDKVEAICGKDTDLILGILFRHNACVVCDNDRISRVNDENAAILIEELSERQREKDIEKRRLVITTTISIVALVLSIIGIFLPLF